MRDNLFPDYFGWKAHNMYKLAFDKLLSDLLIGSCLTFRRQTMYTANPASLRARGQGGAEVVETQSFSPASAVKH